MDLQLCQEIMALDQQAKWPKHIAIILDGNGRWATNQQLPVQAGHRQGAETLIELLKSIKELKLPIQSLTVYALSTENMQRPQEEVDYLLKLFSHYLDNELSELPKQQIKVNVIGKRENLPPALIKRITKVESIVPIETQFTFNIAFNYGGRQEFVEAVKRFASDVLEGNNRISTLDETTLANYMYQPQIDKIDLLIRTGGYNRISNFLLWQVAYAELYFTNVLWPDFKINDFLLAIKDFQQRERKYGKRK